MMASILSRKRKVLWWRIQCYLRYWLPLTFQFQNSWIPGQSLMLWSLKAGAFQSCFLTNYLFLCFTKSKIKDHLPLTKTLSLDLREAHRHTGSWVWYMCASHYICMPLPQLPSQDPDKVVLLPHGHSQMRKWGSERVCNLLKVALLEVRWGLKSSFCFQILFFSQMLSRLSWLFSLLMIIYSASNYHKKHGTFRYN